MKYTYKFGSHLPILIKLIEKTTGPVLELGIGFASTPVLHWLCFEANRELVSYEDNKKYYDKFSDHNHGLHKLIYITDWDSVTLEGNWDVALVDHDERRRIQEIRKLANNTKYVVVHDAEVEAYNYDKIYPLFRYRFFYQAEYAKTVVLSNLVDLGDL